MSDTSHPADTPASSGSPASPGSPETDRSPLRNRIGDLIFNNETRAGHYFNVALIAAILLSIVVVMLDSVEAIFATWGRELALLEWMFTILFTVEYALRLYSARNVRKYATGFFGVVDLLAILPTFLGLIFPPGRFLLTIRVLRVVRVFRVLKLAQFLYAEDVLWKALKAVRRRLLVFMLAVSAIVVIAGSLMYVIEGSEAGFTSIPRGVYWAIVTVTTVGYGDLAPLTPLGQMLAALLMITGYAIIVVPTGIVGLEAGRLEFERLHASGPRRKCEAEACGERSAEPGAAFCAFCGKPLWTPNEQEKPS